MLGGKNQVTSAIFQATNVSPSLSHIQVLHVPTMFYFQAFETHSKVHSKLRATAAKTRAIGGTTDHKDNPKRD